MALEAKVKILPVTIVDSLRVMSAKSLFMTPSQTIHVIVHEPVDTLAFGRRKREELTQTVRSVIASGLPAELRGGAEA